jgi:hypothetical protein
MFWFDLNNLVASIKIKVMKKGGIKKLTDKGISGINNATGQTTTGGGSGSGGPKPKQETTTLGEISA